MLPDYSHRPPRIFQGKQDILHLCFGSGYLPAANGLYRISTKHSFHFPPAHRWVLIDRSIPYPTARPAQGLPPQGRCHRPTGHVLYSRGILIRSSCCVPRLAMHGLHYNFTRPFDGSLYVRNQVLRGHFYPDLTPEGDTSYSDVRGNIAKSFLFAFRHSVSSKRLRDYILMIAVTSPAATVRTALHRHFLLTLIFMW